MVLAANGVEPALGRLDDAVGVMFSVTIRSRMPFPIGPGLAGSDPSVLDAEVPDEGDRVPSGSRMADSCTPLFTVSIVPGRDRLVRQIPTHLVDQSFRAHKNLRMSCF